MDINIMLNNIEGIIYSACDLFLTNGINSFKHKSTNDILTDYVKQIVIKDIKKLQIYEAKITAAKSLGLRKKGITGDFDVKHIKQIHKYLFEDIYPFAGEFRTENIAKGEFRFAQSEYIEPELENLLNKLKKKNYLEGLDKKELAIKLAYYLAELNVLHPFREGNGRTNREFIRQLALKNGYKLDLKKVKAEQILEASIESIVDTKKLEEIIYECLQLGTAPNCP